MKLSRTRTADHIATGFAMLPEESLLTRLSDRLKGVGLEAAKLWTMAAMAGVRIDAVPAPVEIEQKPGGS